MSEWKLYFTPTAERDMRKLSRDIRLRVLEKIAWLQIHIGETPPLPLAGQWKGFFKLRVGDWRIAYRVNHPAQRIAVHCIDKRDKIYGRTPI